MWLTANQTSEVSENLRSLVAIFERSRGVRVVVNVLCGGDSENIEQLLEVLIRIKKRMIVKIVRGWCGNSTV